MRGQLRQSLTPDELRNLRPGDCAIITPVPCKNDPFTEFFGNHPIWLPFDAHGPFNAARWLADLELAFPVAADQRRHVPLFPADDASTPLTHSMADALFHALTQTALGNVRAAQLSLHSPRVFAASALLARGCPRPLIMALCRWKDERSLGVYAHLNPADYIGWVHRMASATVDPIAPRNIPGMAYHYDEAARHADAYLRNNANNNNTDGN